MQDPANAVSRYAFTHFRHGRKKPAIMRKRNEDVVLARLFDCRVGALPVERKRLLDQDRLACIRRLDHLLRVRAIRCCQDNAVDIGCGQGFAI